jgi:hypothetical protein
MSVYTVIQGDTAIFTFDFIDPATGLRPVPAVTGGTLIISYAASRHPASASISLTLASDGIRWTGSWDSSPADLGLGSWAVTPTGGTTPALSGKIRIAPDP